MDSKKTGMRCSVKFCKSKASDENISFFKYPNPNDKRLATWIKNCEAEDLTESLIQKNSYKVCGEHFEDKMFLNVTTKNQLFFNAIPTKFKDNILLKRKKNKQMAEKQCVMNLDLPTSVDLKNLSSCNSSILTTEELSSRSSKNLDISNKSCSSTAKTKSLMQTPGYLSSNTPKNQKLALEIKSGKNQIKNLMKTISSKISVETKNLSGLTTEEKRKILSNNEKKNLISSSDTTLRKIISTTKVTMPSNKIVSTKTSASMETTIIPEKTISNKIIDPKKVTLIPEKSIPTKTTPPIDSRTIPKNTISIETTSRLKTTFPSEVHVNEDSTKQLSSENKDDFCDCYDKTCPGCFFPCESCRSHKCGHQCRLKRDWKRYDRWVIQGRGEEIIIDDIKIEEQYFDFDGDDDDDDDDDDQ